MNDLTSSQRVFWPSGHTPKKDRPLIPIFPSSSSHPALYKPWTSPCSPVFETCRSRRTVVAPSRSFTYYCCKTTSDDRLFIRLLTVFHYSVSTPVSTSVSTLKLAFSFTQEWHRGNTLSVQSAVPSDHRLYSMLTHFSSFLSFLFFLSFPFTLASLS